MLGLKNVFGSLGKEPMRNGDVPPRVSQALFSKLRHTKASGAFPPAASSSDRPARPGRNRSGGGCKKVFLEGFLWDAHHCAAAGLMGSHGQTSLEGRMRRML